MHRKVKIPWGTDVVTVNAQEDLNVATVEGLEVKMPLSGFQVAVIDAPTNESQSAVNRMSPFSRKMMKKMQWKYGKGLGRELQGRFEPLSSACGQQDRRGLGYSENRKKEKYEIRSPIRGPNLNHIFFVPQVAGEFQSREKTYPGLEIFMTDFEEKLIKSPEPSLDQLVEGTDFIVGMTQPSTESEWSKKISEFEDFLGIGDEASKMV
ncbi:hypothetical protein JCGZ_15389 [Jatropha curcas]|uniref:G-patch domain-containing protein n=1 Tax=Jatropha curcas TaxID=180498 RepID=A0A067K5Y0_JATCU|nr:hypothetical protein JCGZ_15389 [Jatropha curcas]